MEIIPDSFCKLTITIFFPLAIITSVIIGVFYFKEIEFKKSDIETHADKMTTMQFEKLRNDFKHIVTDLMFFASYHQTLSIFNNLENPEYEYRRYTN